MSKWKIYTPEGVQDILIEECYTKKNIEMNLRNMFRQWGYDEIETPTIEFYDVFSADSDITPQETMFKFFDQQGRILVLRPEMTIPVARIAATKYKDARHPQRFSYIGNSFRYNELGGGKQKEFTQAGAEIIGTSGPEADAEVIATAIQCVLATGIENFQIDIGQVEFFKGLMEEAGLSDEEIEQARVLIDKKDFLGIEELVEEQGIEGGLKELVLGLPKLFGSVDVIERVKNLTVNKRALKALENLRRVLEIISDYGFEKYVSVDLGMVQSLNYYSGIIFRGFTHGIGFPMISGGRYDGLVGKFGKDCPATGFSIGINLIMMAIDRQKLAIGKSQIEALIGYSTESRKSAVELCMEFRKQGMKIELDVMNRSFEELKQYAGDKGIGGVIYAADGGNIEMHDLLTSETTRTTYEELLLK